MPDIRGWIFLACEFIICGFACAAISVTVCASGDTGMELMQAHQVPEVPSEEKRTDEEPGVGHSKPAGTRPNRPQILALIDRAASRFGVERELIRAIVAAESAYNPNAVSRVGALGLMQLMPATAADYGVTRADALFDPEVNVTAGVRHLKRLLDKYGGDYGRVIMAYNAGEGAVDRAGGHLTYSETIAYTASVIKYYRNNGGVQPIDNGFLGASGVRHLAAKGDTNALGSIRQGKYSRRASSSSLEPSPFSPDLAEDDLDQALRSDLTDGDFRGSL